MLVAVDQNLWVVAAPLNFLGVHVGTRMTVVRLSNGRLWLHSPVPLEPQARADLAALGEVGHIVAPNMFHHLYVGDTASLFPGATVHAVAGLRRKRRDLHIDEMLGPEPSSAWAADLDQLQIEGTWLAETVFFHRATRTLISSDLAENFASSGHWFTRFYLKTQGLENRFRIAWLLRVCYRDKQKARRCIDRMLEWDIERVILAHGRILETGGRDELRAAFDWLK
ncbi:MAG: DUF4336 domain-containing protein [Gammaproteobacteria bacterium]|nr:DUF4336 domain-containing protein [Gammaproteobacteria bacterium]